MSVQEETFDQTFDDIDEPVPETAAAPVEDAPVDNDNWNSAPMSDLPDIKLFGRWSCDDVNVSDISLAVCCFIYVSKKKIQNTFHLFETQFFLRITFLLKKNMHDIHHIQLVGMRQNDSVKHNVQLSNV